MAILEHIAVNFNLDKGLVYTTVTFKGEALSLLIGVENNKFSFDRITLQEYLRNILGGEKDEKK